MAGSRLRVGSYVRFTGGRGMGGYHGKVRRIEDGLALVEWHDGSSVGTWCGVDGLERTDARTEKVRDVMES
jgi:hypothetical protein